MTAPASRAEAGRSASWQANAIAIVVLCSLLVARVADAASTGQNGQVAFVIVLFVQPMLFVIPRTRPLMVRHRWPVLAVQAVLTVMPFFVFGGRWEEGISSLLAGMVLLTLPGRVSWPLAGLLCAAELAVRAAIHGFFWTPAWSAALWVAIVFVDDCLIFFGMVRLADLMEQLQSARAQAAELAIAGERLRAAEELQAAVGERLTDVAALTTAAQHALSGNPAEARERIVAAGVTAREAVARARAVTMDRRGPATPEPIGPARGAVVVPRLAWAILVVLLCGFGLQSLNDIYLAQLTPAARRGAHAERRRQRGAATASFPADARCRPAQGLAADPVPPGGAALRAVRPSADPFHRGPARVRRRVLPAPAARPVALARLHGRGGELVRALGHGARGRAGSKPGDR